MTVDNIARYLDQEFDKVGRLRDGSINEAAMGRLGFKWAVEKVQVRHPHISKQQAQQLVKSAGWY